MLFCSSLRSEASNDLEERSDERSEDQDPSPIKLGSGSSKNFKEIFFGEMSEWLKEHAWKACSHRKVAREFESLSLR